MSYHVFCFPVFCLQIDSGWFWQGFTDNVMEKLKHYDIMTLLTPKFSRIWSSWFGIVSFPFKFNNLCHYIFALHLSIFCFYCQLFICVSTLLSKIPCQSEYWLLFVSILFLFGQWGSRCWTAMVAFSLCLVRCKGDETVRKFKVWIWFFGFGWVRVPYNFCHYYMYVGFNKTLTSVSWPLTDPPTDSLDDLLKTS